MGRIEEIRARAGDVLEVAQIRTHRSQNLTIEDRFWMKVSKSGADDCWEWLACCVEGYGQFFVANGKRVKAHRFAYELLVGTIPDGLTLDHLCRNRKCCNPSHLEPVTVAENVLRGEGPCAQNARRTHCRRCSRLLHQGTSQRYCLVCRRIRLPREEYKNVQP